MLEVMHGSRIWHIYIYIYIIVYYNIYIYILYILCVCVHCNQKHNLTNCVGPLYIYIYIYILYIYILYIYIYINIYSNQKKQSNFASNTVILNSDSQWSFSCIIYVRQTRTYFTLIADKNLFWLTYLSLRKDISNNLNYYFLLLILIIIILLVLLLLLYYSYSIAQLFIWYIKF